MKATGKLPRRRPELVPAWIPLRYLLVGAWALLLVVWCVHRRALREPVLPGIDDSELHHLVAIGVLWPLLIHAGFRFVYVPLSHRIRCVRHWKEATFRAGLMAAIGALVFLLIQIGVYYSQGHHHLPYDPLWRNLPRDELQKVWHPPVFSATQIVSDLLLSGFISAALVEVVATLQLSHVRLAETTQALTRQETEVELARQVQQHLLPTSLPEMKCVEIAAWSLPTRPVGGDFYDAIKLSEDELAVVLGDVSGKGMSAALLMANLQAQVRTRLGVVSDLQRLVGEVNVQLCESTVDGRFATLFLGVYHRRGRMLRFVSAGYDYPFLVSGEDGDANIRELKSTGLPVGVVASARYALGEIPVPVNATLLIYSDGLTDARSPSGEFFGPDRLRACVADSGSMSAQESLKRIYRAVADWSRGVAQADDQTAVVVRFA